MDIQYEHKMLTKSYKTEIKILANRGLAYSGFEQSGPHDNDRNDDVQVVYE